MRKQEPNAWKQAGTIGLWRYRQNVHNYPGWHLATDQPGLASLLDLLARLRACQDVDVYRTIQLTAPSTTVLAVPNNRRSPAIAPKRARLTRNEVNSEWRFEEDGEVLAIDLGVEHLEGLTRWLSRPDTAFDTMYGHSPPLWFWGVIPNAIPPTPR
jgi:hypothetical protein